MNYKNKWFHVASEKKKHHVSRDPRTCRFHVKQNQLRRRQLLLVTPSRRFAP